MFEDSVPEFFGDAAGNDGLFLRILAWSPEALKGDVSDFFTSSRAGIDVVG